MSIKCFKLKAKFLVPRAHLPCAFLKKKVSLTYKKRNGVHLLCLWKFGMVGDIKVEG